MCLESDHLSVMVVWIGNEAFKTRWEGEGATQAILR